MSSRTFVVGLLLSVAVACSSDDAQPTEDPVFPADYAATYQEVRNCRFSLDHDLQQIRVIAAPDALATYTSRSVEFPVGATLLKELYDGGDMDCTGPIIGFAVMQKAEPGSMPETNDWTWQHVTPERKVATEDVQRCVSCHTDCGEPPVGYGGTCAMP